MLATTVTVRQARRERVESLRPFGRDHTLDAVVVRFDVPSEAAARSPTGLPRRRGSFLYSTSLQTFSFRTCRAISTSGVAPSVTTGTNTFALFGVLTAASGLASAVDGIVTPLFVRLEFPSGTFLTRSRTAFTSTSIIRAGCSVCKPVFGYDLRRDASIAVEES